jgi:hypothetical protein
VVAAEGSGGAVGTVTATGHNDLDYAVIKFDPTKVTPVANFDGFPINGIGSDPAFGQPACTQGGATGYGCGSIKFPGLKPADVTAGMPTYQPGDKGAPVTVDDQLVGMTYSGRTFVSAVPLIQVPVENTNIGFTLFSAILDDVNAKGGPGGGFTPVPA